MIKPALSLIVAAVLAVVATLVAPAVGAKEPPKGTSSITLPEKPNEIPAFVAELDDKQARSTLVKVLEERTKPAEAEKLDLFAAAKRATSRIASRIDELAGARGEAALSPVVRDNDYHDDHSWIGKALTRDHQCGGNVALAGTDRHDPFCAAVRADEQPTDPKA